MQNIGLTKNYQISLLILTFIFFAFPLRFLHVNRKRMCLFFFFFTQNLGIHKINKFTVALKLNLNCVLYVYIYIYLFIHLFIYIDSYIFHFIWTGFKPGASEAETDKICFILCILSLHLYLPILLCLQSAALYKQFWCYTVLGGQKMPISIVTQCFKARGIREWMHTYFDYMKINE